MDPVRLRLDEVLHICYGDFSAEVKVRIVQALCLARNDNERLNLLDLSDKLSGNMAELEKIEQSTKVRPKPVNTEFDFEIKSDD